MHVKNQSACDLTECGSGSACQVDKGKAHIASLCYANTKRLAVSALSRTCPGLGVQQSSIHGMIMESQICQIQLFQDTCLCNPHC